MNPCVTRERLERLVGGALDGPEREAVAVHVQHCAACQHVLDELTRVPRAAEPPDPDSLANEEDARLLERLTARGPRAVDEDQAREGPSQDDRPPRERIEAGEAARSLSIAPTPPAIVGFQIIREIGRGGMGVVYEAEEVLLNRRVALKVLPASALHHPKQVERFRREAKAAARLHHTHIVPVFGVGEQGGHPYYVMQYIDGRGLDDVLAELRLLRRDGSSPLPGAALQPPHGQAPPVAGNRDDVQSLRSITAAQMAKSLARGQFEQPGLASFEGESTDAGERATAIRASSIFPANHAPADSSHLAPSGSSKLSSSSNFSRPYFQSVAQIGLQVAEALEYANRQGVLHRDIKPSNLLLDNEGSVRITDFGLAKTDDSEDLTDTGELLGTLRYMAPERFEGRCDIRSDVYSLGLTLYELVALRPAFEASSRHELIEKVLHHEPVRLDKLAPRIPRDLDTIIQKAIAREPAGRYPTAAAIADDLRSFLDGRPIAARPVGAAERAWRWCRRNPWIAASVAILFLGTAVSTWQAIRATTAERTARSAAKAASGEAARAIRAEEETRTQRDRAEVEAERSKVVNEFLKNDMLAQASVGNQATRDARPDPDLKVRTALDRAAAKIGDRFAGQPLVEASIRQTIGETYYQLGLYSLARPHLERALELRRDALGADHPETFSAMHSLGVLLDDDGKWTEAEPYLVPAMEGLRKTKGVDDLETLVAMAGVGNLYTELEKTEEAETLMSQTLDGFRRTRGDTDILTLRTMDNLAMIYLARNKPAQAEQLAEETVRKLRAEVGSDHPATLGARANLASAYAANRKPAEAERLLKDVLKDQRLVLGDKHPDTLYTIALLAEQYMNQGKMDEMEKYAVEALEGSRTVLDNKHQVRAVALGFLATVYSSRADLKKLEPVLIESTELARFRWGPDSGVTAGGNNTVGMLLIMRGEYSGAERYCREAAEFHIKHHPDGRDRFLVELRLGVSLLAQKKCAETRSRLISAYNGLKPRDMSPLSAETSNLSWIVAKTARLRDESGRLLHDVSLVKLRDDPAIQAIVYDPEFPSNPFAPP